MTGSNTGPYPPMRWNIQIRKEGIYFGLNPLRDH
jgi:hypothetical protein